MTDTVSERMLPLYEAKMLDQFDHRDADVVKSPTAEKRQNQPRYLSTAEHQDADRSPVPLAWVAERDMPTLDTDWLSGFSDVTSATNERTVLAAALPRAAVGNTYFLFFGQSRAFLLTCLNSLCLDYVARQKVAGAHLTYGYVKQLAIPSPTQADSAMRWTNESHFLEWITSRALELTFTAWDIEAFARDLGDEGAPFVWDDERRALLRAELDAAFFHLYGVERDDVDYILDTFPIVRRKDEARYGGYRTKQLILEIYDAMAEAEATGTAYQTVLDPPPGDGHRHPARPAT